MLFKLLTKKYPHQDRLINCIKLFFHFRFVPEWLFVNPWFHFGLLLMHIVLLLAAAKPVWHLLKEYAKLNEISQKPKEAIQLLILPLFFSNFIGIVASRSLHYQVSFKNLFERLPNILNDNIKLNFS